jgi:tRNA(Ile)-lysidine synthetase-like protein
MSWDIVVYRPGMRLKERTAVYLDAAKAGYSGVVRSRLAGDRIRGLGMEGSSKLKDLFINGKVSRPNRWRVPVLVLQTGIAAVFFNFADSRKFNYISQDFAVGKEARHLLSFHLRTSEPK